MGLVSAGWGLLVLYDTCVAASVAGISLLVRPSIG
jgi:hypothetical protein